MPMKPTTARKVLGLFLLVFLWAVCPLAAHAQTSFEGRWFAPDSPWNVPVGDSPVMPYSEKAVQAFAELGHLNMNIWNRFTPAVIYGNSAKDRTQDIVFKNGLGHPWTMANVPMPQRLIDYVLYSQKVNDGNGMTCLYDGNKNGFYSFWRPRSDGHEITISFGGFSPLDGPGWSRYATHRPVRLHDTPSLGRAVGASYCGGLIRASEIKAGRIDHALAVMWPKRFVRGWKSKEPVVFPATSTDGSATDEPFAVPAGARIQLDPSLTDRQLIAMGLNDIDLIVAHALQEYGGYIVDTGGETQYIGAICFENMMTSPNKKSFLATSHWPPAISKHFRFVGPPPEVPLDTAHSVGTPVPN